MDLEIGPCLPGWARRNDQRSSTIHLSIITACLVDDEDFLTIDAWKLWQRMASSATREGWLAQWPGLAVRGSHLFEREKVSIDGFCPL
jgi:hypothetical protein